MQGDSPLANTGLGRLTRYILSELKKETEIEYDITLVGVNHFTTFYDMEKYPYKIHSPLLTGEPQGYSLFAQLLKQEAFDIVFISNDIDVTDQFQPDIEEAKKRNKNLKYIVYSPFDMPTMRKERLVRWKTADKCITYNKFGYDLALNADNSINDKLDYVFLPTDFSEFYPENKDKIKDFRKRVFGIDDDTFLVLNVNRNQWRKDLGRTMFGFQLFNTVYDKSLLYIHAKQNDMGGDLTQIAYVMGLTEKNFKTTPDSFHEAKGVGQNQLNMIYNSADVVVSTATGGGWEFSTTEAMATKRPILVPDNTCFTEIIGQNEERGYLAKCGTTLSEWSISYGFGVIPRPLTNVESFVTKLTHIYKNKDEAMAKTEVAYNWLKQNCDINDIGQKWRNIFKSIS